MEYKGRSIYFTMIDENGVLLKFSISDLAKLMNHEELVDVSDIIDKFKQDQQAVLDLEKVSRAEKLKELKERADQACISYDAAILEYQSYKNTYFKD